MSYNKIIKTIEKEIVITYFALKYLITSDFLLQIKLI